MCNTNYKNNHSTQKSMFYERKNKKLILNICEIQESIYLCNRELIVTITNLKERCK